MRRLLLINPNTREETTAMMVELARASMPDGYFMHGVSAQSGVPLIVNEDQLRAAGTEVVQSWFRAGPDWSGVIIGAFGDPGIDALRAIVPVPVVGLCEAAMLEASAHGRFGVATITPELEASISSRVSQLGLASTYTGIRLTHEDPRTLVSDPDRLERALAGAIGDCIEKDGADAVIIGGGPLGRAAVKLAPRFKVPIVAPIHAAVQLLDRRIVALQASVLH